jgi:hypothetical protein
LTRQKILAQPGHHSVQKNRFGLACGVEHGPHATPPALQSAHTVSQWRFPALLRPGTQNSSHLQPQHVTSTFFSSHTNRQHFWHVTVQPQWSQHGSPPPALADRAITAAAAKAAI